MENIEKIEKIVGSEEFIDLAGRFDYRYDFYGPTYGSNPESNNFTTNMNNSILESSRKLLSDAGIESSDDKIKDLMQKSDTLNKAYKSNRILLDKMISPNDSGIDYQNDYERSLEWIQQSSNRLHDAIENLNEQKNR